MVSQDHLNIEDTVKAYESANKSETCYNNFNSINCFGHSSLQLCRTGERISEIELREQYSSDNSNLGKYSRRGLGAFFIYRKEQQDKKRERIENQPRLNIIYEPVVSPATYCPNRSSPNPRHLGQIIHRKFFRVAIENNGGGIAYQCNARLRILDNQPFGTPSLEVKQLQWDSLRINQDIGVNDHAIVDVLFSDDREFRDRVNMELAKKAFVSTPHNLEKENINFPQMEDGFNVGDYKFELVVREMYGTSSRVVFIAHINNNWEETSIEKIH